MNNNLTEMVFILDRSGSMVSLTKDTIGGYNSMIEKQKKEEGDAVITTVLFDDQYDILYEHASIDKIQPLTEREYYARGTTALCDAIGKTINHVIRRCKTAPDNEIASKTLFVIITDGYENASREYSQELVHRMISYQKEKYNWEFLFLGANIDAVKTAENIGISEDRAVTYCADEEGTRMNFDTVSNVATCVRQNAKIKSGWKKEIENYRKSKER